jgi:hypothetical protein
MTQASNARSGIAWAAIAFEADGHWLSVRARGSRTRGQAALPQMTVQGRQIGDVWHGRGPLPLEIINAVLDPRLLSTGRRQAKLRAEAIVRDQRRIAWVQGSLAPPQDAYGHRRRIVPPELQGYAFEERKSFDETLQDGLGALGR